MKKNSIRLMGGILLAFFAFSANLFALEVQSSYRSSATAGMFKQEVDRIFDNPAYIGAKLDQKNYIEYDKSITKEKTNIYTGLTGYNSDNKYLLGGSTKVMDMFGIACGIELGYNNTPNNVSINQTVGGVNVTAAGQGETSGSGTLFTDSNADGVWDNQQSLSATKENNTEETIINGILGLGGINLGGLTLGVSFFKLSDTSEVNKSSYKYHYSNYNMLTDFNNLTTDYSSTDNSEVDHTDYIMNMGFVLPVASTPIEGIFTFALNTEEIITLDENSTTNVTNETISATSGSVTKSSRNNDGYTIGVVLQTRFELFSFMATPAFSWKMGGNSPFKEGTNVNGSNSSTEQLLNAAYVNNTTTTNTTKYKGDGIQKNYFTLGSNFRKALTPDLLVGFGATYGYLMSTNKYESQYTHRTVTVSNDANGIVDAADYTLVNSSGYTDTTEETITAHTIMLPIGVEYAATPTLTFRLGYSFVADFSFTDTTVKRSNVQASYNDYDYESTPGNETTSDGLAGTTASGAKAETDSVKDYTMTNVYTAGIGYSLADRVQLDLMFSAAGGNFNTIDSAAVTTSATFVF